MSASESTVRESELARLRRQVAVLSGRPDQRSVSSADPTEDVLPVPEALADVLPHGGITRGGVVSVSGARSVLLSIIASVSGSGGQVGVVGLPHLNLLAAIEMGAEVGRIATVPNPGVDPVEVATVLLDGMDLVVLGLRGVSVPPARSRVVMGRVRKQSAALMVTGGRWPAPHTRLDAEVLAYRHHPVAAGSTDLTAAPSGFGRIGGLHLRVTATGRGRQVDSTEIDLVSTGPAAMRRVELVRATGCRPADAADTRTVLAVAN
ncbi:hypothetical protein [Gordonia soli]|uniref:Uncharacterized protein n=1 Tax=Gordonia soli NBRC 108243 TaxID=1223545 RepID=M0QMU3_9ACTN|nr:hypothetical protein [Gordonia soli]GAC69868.1 hypothetical protein GS4_28_01160 [Gordonia soli NBRC 108243]